MTHENCPYLGKYEVHHCPDMEAADIEGFARGHEEGYEDGKRIGEEDCINIITKEIKHQEQIGASEEFLNGMQRAIGILDE